MSYYGPWTQPDDTDGVALGRTANRQSVEQSFTAGAYPTFPAAGTIPLTGSGSNGWDIANVLDPFTGTLTQWVWILTEWVLAIDVQYQIDNIPDVVMPPVSPPPPDPNIVGVEYEATAGVALGAVTIRFPNLTALSRHRFADVTLTAPASAPPDSDSLELHKLTSVEYTWDRIGPPAPVLYDWWTGPDIAAAPLLVSIPANPGLALVPDFSGPPTDTWYGSDLAGDPGNTRVDFDVATTLAALDGGDYAVIAATGMFISETTTVLPSWTDSGGTIEPVRQSMGFPDDFPGTDAITALIRYRPPRYRWVYDLPPAQRQFPRDDGLGISTRRSWPPPTSTQYSQRRGPNATYQ